MKTAIKKPKRNRSKKKRSSEEVSRATYAVSKKDGLVVETQADTASGFKAGMRKLSSSSVAPFIKTANASEKAMRSKDWARRGFVPVAPHQEKLRYRILPRSVVGLAVMLLAFSVGIAFSGAAFYAYYDNRLADNEQAVSRFVDGFDQQFNDAAGALDEMRSGSITEIRQELAPLEAYAADADGVVRLPQTIGESVWLLESRDSDGRLVTGSAYAVIGHNGGTALVTSYSLIDAATTEPAPAIELVKNNERISAQLWAWDSERDLALLAVDKTIPTLELATNVAQVEAVGSRVFAMSGVGGQGATASPGVMVDNSPLGLQHTSLVGTLFRGGPLVNGEGKVLGMASTAYSPYGIDAGAVGQAPDVRSLCVKILKCSETDDIVGVEVAPVDAVAPEPVDEGVRDVAVDQAVVAGEDSSDAEAEAGE